jgi:hypothetical protein
VRWARRQKLTGLDLAASRWDGPTGLIDTEARWQQARRFLHDDTLNPEDRAAGLLVLLYAQRAATLSRLTLEHVQTYGQQVRIRLGREPVLLPELEAAFGDRTMGGQLDRGRASAPWTRPAPMPRRPCPSSCGKGSSVSCLRWNSKCCVG